MNRVAISVSLLISFLALNLIFNVSPAAAQATKGQGSHSIAKARKLILQLQSWSLEDESPPVGTFRALQKQVSKSVAELQKQGRVKDAKTLALWNKSVSSKHFSKDSIPYLAAVSDMVVATSNQKEHNAQLTEFNSLYNKIASTDMSHQAKQIKSAQESALAVQPQFQIINRGKKDSTGSPASIKDMKPTTEQAQAVKQQILDNQAKLKKMFGK